MGEILGELMQMRQLAGGARIGRLASSWSSVVGDRLASETAPVRLESRVLTVAATSGPWGTQARFLADEIARRANEELGSQAIERVVIVVSEERRKPL